MSLTLSNCVRGQRSEGNIANVTGSSDIVTVGVLHQAMNFVELLATFSLQTFPFKEFTGFIIPARVLRLKSAVKANPAWSKMKTDRTYPLRMCLREHQSDKPNNASITHSLKLFLYILKYIITHYYGNNERLIELSNILFINWIFHSFVISLVDTQRNETLFQNYWSSGLKAIRSVNASF